SDRPRSAGQDGAVDYRQRRTKAPDVAAHRVRELARLVEGDADVHNLDRLVEAARFEVVAQYRAAALEDRRPRTADFAQTHDQRFPMSHLFSSSLDVAARDAASRGRAAGRRSEEHTSELQSRQYLVC